MILNPILLLAANWSGGGGIVNGFRGRSCRIESEIAKHGDFRAGGVGGVPDGMANRGNFPVADVADPGDSQ